MRGGGHRRGCGGDGGGGSSARVPARRIPALQGYRKANKTSGRNDKRGKTRDGKVRKVGRPRQRERRGGSLMAPIQVHVRFEQGSWNLTGLKRKELRNKPKGRMHRCVPYQYWSGSSGCFPSLSHSGDGRGISDDPGRPSNLLLNVKLELNGQTDTRAPAEIRRLPQGLTEASRKE